MSAFIPQNRTTNDITDESGQVIGFSVEQSIYNTPSIEEVKDDNFVTFELGNFRGSEDHKNSFFDHLLECYAFSNTNKACIDSISDMVYGLGIAMEGKDGEPVSSGAGNTKIGKLEKMLTVKDLKRVVKDRILFGQAAIQITYGGTGRRKKIEKLTHFPIQTLAFERMKMGESRAVFYHPNWREWKKGDTLTRIPLFGHDEDPTGTTEIAILKPYVPGYYYFALPQYSGGLDYCVMEGRISEFLINDIDSGFSGTTLINVNRRIKDQDKRDYMTAALKEKAAGVHGDRTFVFYNNNPQEQVSIERFPLSDAPNHYEYLSQEASRKILTSHRITNPKILAVPTPGEMGLGNNANEIQVASEMLQNLVVGPIQNEVIDFLEEILQVNNMKEDLMFIPLEVISKESFEQGFYNDQTALNNFDQNEDKEEVNPNKAV